MMRPMSSRIRQPMPLTLLTAILLDVLFVVFLGVVVVLNIIGAVSSFAASETANGLLALLAVLIFGGSAFLPLVGARRLAQRNARGAVASNASTGLTTVLALLALTNRAFLLAGA